MVTMNVVNPGKFLRILEKNMTKSVGTIVDPLRTSFHFLLYLTKMLTAALAISTKQLLWPAVCGALGTIREQCCHYSSVSLILIRFLRTK